MADSDLRELYRRVGNVEKDGAVMQTQMTQLTKATTDNTSALQDVTDALKTVSDTLSYNKGAVAASMKIIGIGIVIAGGFGTFLMWLSGFLHFGKPTP